MAVLITGGNRGLGFALAGQLLRDGRDVILTTRSAGSGREAASALLAKTGRAPLDVLELDLQSPASVDGLVKRLKDGYQHPLECLVNNAGIYPDGWTQAVWDEARAVNAVSPISLAVQMAPVLMEGGRVVMVSSGYGQLQYCSKHYQEEVLKAQSVEDLMKIPFNPEDAMMRGEFKPTYKVSKLLLNRATQILSSNPVFASRQIAISACCPGWCNTDMGGQDAPRTPVEGAASIAWLVTHASPMPSGGFFREGKVIAW